MLWWIILIVSSILSDHPYFSLETSILYIRHLIFSFSIYFILINYPYAIRYFTYSMIIIFLILILDGYYQFFYGQNILGFASQQNRLSSLFGDELILGNFLSRLFPLFFALIIFVFNNSKKYVVLSLFVFIASDVLIFISGERTAFALLFLSTLLIICSIKKWQKIRIITFVVSLLVICMLALLNSNVSQRMITQTFDQINPNNEEVYIFSKQHESHYIASLEMFSDSYLIGVGPNNFRKKCSSFNDNAHESDFGKNLACSTHPHNSYIQLLAETGIIGTLPIIISLIYISFLILNHLFKKFFLKKELFSDFQVCLLIAVFITLWPFIPTMNLFNNWISIIYYLPLGFLIYSFDVNQKITT